jgi:hypothetical protein
MRSDGGWFLRMSEHTEDVMDRWGTATFFLGILTFIVSTVCVLVTRFTSGHMAMWSFWLIVSASGLLVLSTPFVLIPVGRRSNRLVAKERGLLAEHREWLRKYRSEK